MSKPTTDNRFGVPEAEIAPSRLDGEPLVAAEADLVAVEADMNSPLRAERRVEQLIDRLPTRMRAATRWLRRPSARWARIPAGILFVLGGLLSILPLLGIWMLPLGLLLLAEDAPFLRRLRDYVLDKIERRWPGWFAPGTGETATKTPPASRSP